MASMGSRWGVAFLVLGNGIEYIWILCVFGCSRCHLDLNIACNMAFLAHIWKKQFLKQIEVSFPQECFWNSSTWSKTDLEVSL